MLKTILHHSNTDSDSKTLTNSRVSTSRDSSCLLKDHEKNKKFAGYLTVERSVNHELRITACSRLPGKNLGDKAPEKKSLMQARYLEAGLKRLKDKLDNNKNFLSNLIKEYDKKPRPELWDKMATLRLENIEIEQTLYRSYSEYFTPDGQTSLGITNQLQAVELESIVAKVKSLNKKQKIDFSLGNKPTKFSKKARHSMLEYGEVMDRECKDKFFTTITLPGRTHNAKKAIADFSSHVSNILNQIFRDFKKYFGIEPMYMYAWEWHKDGTLHIHYIWGGNFSEFNIEYIKKKFLDRWLSLLDQFGTREYCERGRKAGFFPGVNMYERLPEHIERGGKPEFKHIKSWKNHKSELLSLGKLITHEKINKSAARYISKYASKAAKTQANPKVKKWYCPNSWWGASKNLKVLAAKERIKFIIPIASPDYDDLMTMVDQLLSQLVENQGIVYYHKQFWDIYSTLDTKQKRINRKPWEPRPVNALRVSTGSRLIIYITPDQFDDITELIKAIAAIADNLNRAGPTDFNKFHANRYYVPADHYQQEA